MTSRVEVSYKTIIFTAFFLLGLWFVYSIIDIIFALFVSFILMSALRPSVEKLEKYHIPRAISIGVIYIILIFLVSFTLSSIIPPLISETVALLRNVSPTGQLPFFYEEILNFFKNLDFNQFQKITPYGGNILDVLRVGFSFFGGIVSALTLLVFTFYLLLERKNLSDLMVGLLGEESGKRGVAIVTAVELRLGGWMRGQLFLSLLIGLVSFIGLFFLKIPYALPLSILAGIFEIVPVIGPIIAGIPAVLVALTISPGLALVTAVLYFVIQQAENHLVVPTVMRKAVGLSPVIIIVAIMVGGKLGGIGGALLAIPLVLVIQTVVVEIVKNKQI